MPHQLTYQHSLHKLYKIGSIAYQETQSAAWHRSSGNMQTVATIRHGTRDRIPQQNTEKAQEQEIPQIAQKRFTGNIFVTGMAKFGAGKIWHAFLNTMGKFGTILLCQISPFPPIFLPSSMVLMTNPTKFTGAHRFANTSECGKRSCQSGFPERSCRFEAKRYKRDFTDPRPRSSARNNLSCSPLPCPQD